VLLGGNISPPHLHLPPFLQVTADGIEPNKSHPLYSLVPNVSMQVSADDWEPKKPHPLYKLALKNTMTIQKDYVSSILAMSGIDGEYLPICLPSHQQPKLAEVKQGNTGLPYCNNNNSMIIAVMLSHRGL